mmetsp:Transcript_17244/g.41389  ORF Transcript_17244/g.41389 Transcript_17244/m.41389 type:complete len:265 (-) Transcript_17244:482-1276(-)
MLYPFIETNPLPYKKLNSSPPHAREGWERPVSCSPSRSPVGTRERQIVHRHRWPRYRRLLRAPRSPRTPRRDAPAKKSRTSPRSLDPGRSAASPAGGPHPLRMSPRGCRTGPRRSTLRTPPGRPGILPSTGGYRRRPARTTVRWTLSWQETTTTQAALVLSVPKISCNRSAAGLSSIVPTRIGDRSWRRSAPRTAPCDLACRSRRRGIFCPTRRHRRAVTSAIPDRNHRMRKPNPYAPSATASPPRPAPFPSPPPGACSRNPAG